MKMSWITTIGLPIACALPLSLRAQTSSPIGRGSWIVGGTARFDNFRDETAKQSSTSVALAPSGLYFVRRQVAIGTTALLGYTRGSGRRSTSYGIGPTARLYFGDSASRILPFLSASVSPQRITSHTDRTVVNGLAVPQTDASSSVLDFDGSAGLTWMAATHVGLTGEAFYTRSKLSFDVASAPDRTAHDMGLRFGVTAFVF
jgi:hypothetical protein